MDITYICLQSPAHVKLMPEGYVEHHSLKLGATNQAAVFYKMGVRICC